MKKVSIYLLSGFYIFAGLNHFVSPEFYLPLIPNYLGFPELINHISGIAEILLGIGLLFQTARKIASSLTVLMLIAFIPSHIYFIQIGSCVDDGLCVPEWIGWLRLILIHPLLIWWAWSARKYNTSI